MQLEISDAIAQRLKKQAARHGFQSVEEYLAFLVEEPEPDTASDPSRLSYEQWQKRFRDFIARQVSRNPNFDDSRESIYLDPQ